jgi:hypothetical protein
MELANIEKLLEKYLNAETSLQEEATLKNYFTEGTIAPHLQEYKSMFTYFTLSKEETYTKTIELDPKKSKRSNLKWLSVAASLALLVSVYTGSKIYKQQKLEQQYAQVSKALQMLSSTLKKGEKAVSHLYAYENTVNKILK